MNFGDDCFDDSFIDSQLCFDLELFESPFTDEDLKVIERIEQEAYNNNNNNKGGKTYQCSVCFSKFKKYIDLRQHKTSHHTSKQPQSQQSQVVEIKDPDELRYYEDGASLKYNEEDSFRLNQEAHNSSHSQSRCK